MPKSIIMKATIYCQSCSMPLHNEESKGTEKDFSKNNEYCRFCYKEGAFTNPEMTLKEMKIHVKTQMLKMNFPESAIQNTLKKLPELKRWKNKVRKYELEEGDFA